jgi:2-octaprenyl-6-methoxyphenol hydroxylase
MDTDHGTDVAIVGGGLNGPLAALALTRAGLRCTVLDARPRADFAGAGFDGRSYALALGSVRMLAALDLWDGIAPDAQPIEGIRASDGRAGEGASRLHLRFDAQEIGEAYMGQMVEDRHLRPALLAACDAAGVDMRYGVRVVAQDVAPEGATLALEGGERLGARLILGCDGRGSGTAERAGIGRTGRDYAQTALVCAVAHEEPHHGIAHQFFMPAGPLAILPLRGNRASIVWTEAPEVAAGLRDLSDAAYLDVLRPRFGSFLGDIALAGGRHDYPLTLTLAERFTAPRVALLGDAAHGIHPIAGQGLNLGLRDVAALRDVIVDARRRGEDWAGEGVLARYAHARRGATAAMAAATDGVNRLFSNDLPGLRLARRLGMGAVSAMPALRRAFIREAAGLGGTVPTLMR